MSDPRSIALAGAAQATEATAELIRFNREGPSWPGPFGEIEVVEKLADALKLALEVEALAATADTTTQEDRAALYAALIDYLEGWMG